MGGQYSFGFVLNVEKKSILNNLIQFNQVSSNRQLGFKNLNFSVGFYQRDLNFCFRNTSINKQVQYLITVWIG